MGAEQGMQKGMQQEVEEEEEEVQHIAWEDFSKVDIRLGTVVSAQVFEQARKPAYIVHVDFGGEIGVKKTSAQITALYHPEDLPGKRVFAVVNFPPMQIAHIMSECLLLGVYRTDGEVVLATLDTVTAATPAAVSKNASASASTDGALVVPDGLRLL